jgi:AcrR family transcriptional regulator
MSNQPSRRDRVRAATLAEIKDTARQVLVQQGVEGLSLRGIAREMGLTAPALYRYFPSREALLEDLIADLYDELSGTLELARDREPPEDIGGRLLAASRGFRHWALAHPREFGLMFGSPVPGVFEEGPEHEQSRRHQAGLRFGAVFGTLIAQLYQTQPFPAPADEEIDPVLRQQLATWCAGFPFPLPLGVAQTFMSCWIRVYGLVCMEVFGHLDFALTDAEPMFEAELRDLGRLLNLADQYRPPARRPASGGAASAVGLRR